MMHLNREAAGLDEEIWQRIDATALRAAAARLTARRYLDVDGPYGIGLTSLEGGAEERIAEHDPVAAQDGLAVTVGSRALPVPMLQQPCALSVRRVEGHRQLSLPLDLRVGFSANDGVHLKLFVSESLVLLLDDPGAICTLEPEDG